MITRIDVTDAYYGHPFGTGAVLDYTKGSPSGPMGAQLERTVEVALAVRTIHPKGKLLHLYVTDA